MLNYKEFLNENNKEVWTYEGSFSVTDDMVENGKFIKGKIPTIVTGSFNCSDNNLTSLEGGPKEVRENFYCNINGLTSLIGGPIKVGRYFDCTENKLTSLEGAPKEVGSDFRCVINEVPLEIEKNYVLSDSYEKYFDKYYVGLLNYCITNKIDLEKIKTWPKDFLTDNIKTSSKSINKFNL